MAKESDSKKIDYIQEKVDSLSDTCANIDKEVALQKQAFDDHLKQDERMYGEFKRMCDILQENTDSLKEHMAQTFLLKEVVMKMDARLQPIEIEYIQKTAVKDWVMSKAKFLAKVGTAVSAIGGIIWTVMKVLSHLHW